jgi:hypothetical protein
VPCRKLADGELVAARYGRPATFLDHEKNAAWCLG